ncbi:Glucitol operon repressor [compost metagenome]
MAEKANQLILLADASKFGRSTLLTYSPLDKVDAVITSPGIPMEYATYCEEHGIAVHIAEEE